MSISEGRDRYKIISIILIIIIILETVGLSSLYMDLWGRYSSLYKNYDELSSKLDALSTKLGYLESIMRYIGIRHGNYTTLTPAELYNMTERSVVMIIGKRESVEGIINVQGSGFVYDKSGHIITNYHVIEDCFKIYVLFYDRTEVKAEVVGSDPYTDIAVLKVNVNPSILYPVTFGDSSKLEVGDPVYAIGNPFGLAGTMTSGIISGLRRTLPTVGGYSIVDVIQFDAAVNPGNSGGPLIDAHGRVIGITTAIMSETGTFSGVGFAVPSDIIFKVVPSILKYGYYHHPWMGVQIMDMNPEIAKVMNTNYTKGVLVIRVLKDSPAYRAGLRGGYKEVTIDNSKILVDGDIIIGINDTKVESVEDLLVYVERNAEPGDQVILTIVREGKILDLKLILGIRPPPS